MAEPLRRLEGKRRILRNRLRSRPGISGDRYLAVAGALFLLMMVPPITGIEVPVIAVLVLGALLLLPLAPVLL